MKNYGNFALKSLSAGEKSYIDNDSEFQEERKIERRSKRFELERERKVLENLNATFRTERERSQFFLSH